MYLLLDRVRNVVVRARTGVRRELVAKVDMNICSDRILTFGIRSICSPAKVGLVVTELLITSR